MAQPQDFYKCIGAAYLQYNDIDEVRNDLEHGFIDEYTAAQALTYGEIEGCEMDWEDAVALVDTWMEEIF